MNEFFIEPSSNCSWSAWFIYSSIIKHFLSWSLFLLVYILPKLKYMHVYLLRAFVLEPISLSLVFVFVSQKKKKKMEKKDKKRKKEVNGSQVYVYFSFLIRWSKSELVHEGGPKNRVLRPSTNKITTKTQFFFFFFSS